MNGIKRMPVMLMLFALMQPCNTQNIQRFDDTAVKDSGGTLPVFKIGGKIETIHGFRWNKGAEYGASRSVAHIRGEASIGASYAVLSGSAEYNYRNPARTGFQLNEAYYRYTGKVWDISLGRQIIKWGIADGFTVTDVLGARDTSECIAFRGDDTRLPSDSIRLRFLHTLFTVDAVAIPFFTPNKRPRFSFEAGAENDACAIAMPETENSLTAGAIPVRYTKTAGVKPKMFTDTEAALRLSFRLPAANFSLSGFYGWDKNPQYIKNGYVKKALQDPASPHSPSNPFRPQNLYTYVHEAYYRIGMAGFDAAIPVGDVTIRLETAWAAGRGFEPKSTFAFIPSTELQDPDYSLDVPLVFNAPVKKHQLLALAGIDWTKGSWTINAQYLTDLILNHKNDIKRPVHKGFVSINLRKTFLNKTLTFSANGIVDVNYGSSFGTGAITYALSDKIQFALGADVYAKDFHEKGHFTKLQNMSALWLKGSFTW